jgi:hypothetical protein
VQARHCGGPGPGVESRPAMCAGDAPPDPLHARDRECPQSGRYSTIDYNKQSRARTIPVMSADVMNVNVHTAFAATVPGGLPRSRVRSPFARRATGAAQNRVQRNGLESRNYVGAITYGGVRHRQGQQSRGIRQHRLAVFLVAVLEGRLDDPVHLGGTHAYKTIRPSIGISVLTRTPTDLLHCVFPTQG